MLSLFKKVKFNDDITNDQCRTYTPLTEHSKNNDEIRIMIQNQDAYLNISESVLKFRGTVSVPAPNVIAANKFKIINNGYMHLFQEMTYYLNGVPIDSMRWPGIGTTMKAATSFSEGESKCLDIAGWHSKREDSHTNFVYHEVGGHGSFVVAIPLRFIFGFAERYKNVLMNAKHELVLLRSSSDINVYKTDYENVTIELSKIEWQVPHIALNDEKRSELLDALRMNKKISMPFRKWTYIELPALRKASSDEWSVHTASNLQKPRYIIVALQENAKRARNGDCSTFNHCNIRNVRVRINEVDYPHDQMNLDYAANDYRDAYLMYVAFQRSYYGKAISEPIINYLQFKDSPLYVFDCSKQSDALTGTNFDTRIEFESTVKFPDQTRVCCLVISDNIYEYSPLSGIVEKLR